MGTFQEQLIAFANTAILRVAKCANEEQTKLYLVIPFLHLLGYDAGDPSQVVANPPLTSQKNTKIELISC